MVLRIQTLMFALQTRRTCWIIKAKQVEKRDRIRMLMSHEEENIMMEVSTVIIEAKSSLINNLYDEGHN